VLKVLSSINQLINDHQKGAKGTRKKYHKALKKKRTKKKDKNSDEQPF